MSVVPRQRSARNRRGAAPPVAGVRTRPRSRCVMSGSDPAGVPRPPLGLRGHGSSRRAQRRGDRPHHRSCPRAAGDPRPRAVSAGLKRPTVAGRSHRSHGTRREARRLRVVAPVVLGHDCDAEPGGDAAESDGGGGIECDAEDRGEHDDEQHRAGAAHGERDEQDRSDVRASWSVVWVMKHRHRRRAGWLVRRGPGGGARRGGGAGRWSRRRWWRRSSRLRPPPGAW